MEEYHPQTVSRWRLSSRFSYSRTFFFLCTITSKRRARWASAFAVLRPLAGWRGTAQHKHAAFNSWNEEVSAPYAFGFLKEQKASKLVTQKIGYMNSSPSSYNALEISGALEEVLQGDTTALRQTTPKCQQPPPPEYWPHAISSRCRKYHFALFLATMIWVNLKFGYTDIVAAKSTRQTQGPFTSWNCQPRKTKVHHFHLTIEFFL